MGIIESPISRATALYTGIFLVSIPVWMVLLPHKHVIADNPICAFFNALFITHYGYVWFTLAFMGHMFQHVGPLGKVATPVVQRYIVKFVLYLAISIGIDGWFFGPLMVERLNVLTGGHCDSQLTMEECRADPYSNWIDGFDLSGHYLFLITLSLLVLSNIGKTRELRNGDLEAQSGGVSNTVRVLQKSVRTLCNWLLAIWFLEFCLTSVFFHTIGERAAGLIAIPIAFFIIWVGDLIKSDRVLHP